MDFTNVYEDERRAESYAKLEFPGTYYLAYRDLPEIIGTHAKGMSALDFGCGAGRSTRFARDLGFQTVGVDISPDMIRRAREMDPAGDYRLIEDGRIGLWRGPSFDLVLSVFTFDNIPTMERKVALFREFGTLLKAGGRIVHLCSSPEIYWHEWVSFTTKDFPENRTARTGDKVKIIMTDVEDRRPVEDVLWMPEAYLEVFERAGLRVVQTHKPLGRDGEPALWVNERTVAPWTVYVLENKRIPRPAF
jgi:SAM-dependent methyltransferase